MLEFIIVAAPMLAVVMLIVDFGRGLNYQQVMWARRVAPTAADLQAVFELIASKILMRLSQYPAAPRRHRR
jgi:hypothetical protein